MAKICRSNKAIEAASIIDESNQANGCRMWRYQLAIRRIAARLNDGGGCCGCNKRRLQRRNAAEKRRPHLVAGNAGENKTTSGPYLVQGWPVTDL
jgi:hypothetical protein